MARALSVCAEPGCPVLVPVGRCEEHTAAKTRAYRKTSKSRGHDSPAWRRLSQRIRRERPYCEDASHADMPEIMRPPSACVDHLQGLGPNAPRGLDPELLQALCWPCHSRRTGRDFGFGSRSG